MNMRIVEIERMIVEQVDRQIEHEIDRQIDIKGGGVPHARQQLLRLYNNGIIKNRYHYLIITKHRCAYTPRNLRMRYF